MISVWSPVPAAARIERLTSRVVDCTAAASPAYRVAFVVAIAVNDAERLCPAGSTVSVNCPPAAVVALYEPPAFSRPPAESTSAGLTATASGRLRTRLRGLGAEKLMPPGGESLPKTEPGYAGLLNTVDLFVSRMVPGTPMRIKLGLPQRKFVSKANKECGEIPAAKVVVVTQRSAVEKPGFSRFFRPADPYLNGECSDDDGYYIRQEFLVPVQ